jgi:hypothetical protein
MKTKRSSWFVLVLVLAGLGTAVAAAGSRSGMQLPAAITYAELPTPGLDRAVSRLAAEARATRPGPQR